MARAATPSLTGFRAIVPGEGVVSAQDSLRAYESDGLTAYRQRPLAVVLPRNTEEVAAVLRLCARYKVKVVPRGSGTSPFGRGLGRWRISVVVGMGRFNRILDIDIPAPGRDHAAGRDQSLGITQAVAGAGLSLARLRSVQPGRRASIGGQCG